MRPAAPAPAPGPAPPPEDDDGAAIGARPDQALPRRALRGQCRRGECQLPADRCRAPEPARGHARLPSTRCFLDHPGFERRRAFGSARRRCLCIGPRATAPDSPLGHPTGARKHNQLARLAFGSQHIHDINSQVAQFRDLLLSIGQPRDCPELRERVRKLRRSCVEACKSTSMMVLPQMRR